MRTTLDLDLEIVEVVKTLARDRNQSMGKTLSELARLGLKNSGNPAPRTRNGIPLLPSRSAGPVTTELVRTLLEAED